jgi:hypothetical protein
MDFERARHQSETHRNVKPRQFISLIVLNDFSVSLSSRKIKRQMVPLQVATHCTLFPCSMDMRCILRASTEHARRVHDHCGARQRALKLGCAPPTWSAISFRLHNDLRTAGARGLRAWRGQHNHSGQYM